MVYSYFSLFLTIPVLLLATTTTTTTTTAVPCVDNQPDLCSAPGAETVFCSSLDRAVKYCQKTCNKCGMYSVLIKAAYTRIVLLNSILKYQCSLQNTYVSQQTFALSSSRKVWSSLSVCIIFQYFHFCRTWSHKAFLCRLTWNQLKSSTFLKVEVIQKLNKKLLFFKSYLATFIQTRHIVC